MVYNEISTQTLRVLKAKSNVLAMEKGKKSKIFEAIVEEYIKSANPVGSTLIVDKYFSDISSATVRNYMVELENEGLICQPYTSAGRIPTELGYQYYVNNILDKSSVTGKEKNILDELVKKIKDRDQIKILAKELAGLSSEAVLIGFGPNDVYYTGISNLFSQPEFSRQAQVFSMSEIIDHLDEVMEKIFTKIEDEVEILIGQNNPFGEMSSVVLSKYDFCGDDILLGILGPMRMNYQQSVALIEYSKEILKKKK